MTEPWLTKKELADRLKVSPRTIQRRVRPHVVVGGQNRYLLSDALAQLSGEDGELPDNVVRLRPDRKEIAA